MWLAIAAHVAPQVLGGREGDGRVHHGKDCRRRVQVIATDLQYPVLSIAKDGDLCVHADAASLETANGLALRRNVFQDMLLIDSDGRTCKVTSVVGRTPGTRLWGFRFMKPRLYRVNLSLEAMEARPLAAVKKHVLAAIDRNPDIWDADGALDMRRSLIEQASTVHEVMAALR